MSRSHIGLFAALFFEIVVSQSPRCFASGYSMTDWMNAYHRTEGYEDAVVGPADRSLWVIDELGYTSSTPIDPSEVDFSALNPVEGLSPTPPIVNFPGTGPYYEKTQVCIGGHWDFSKYDSIAILCWAEYCCSIVSSNNGPYIPPIPTLGLGDCRDYAQCRNIME